MTSPNYIANSKKHTLISSRRKARAYSLLGERSCTRHGPACSPIPISRSRSTTLPCLEPTPELALSPVKLRFNEARRPITLTRQTEPAQVSQRKGRRLTLLARADEVIE